LRAWAAQAARTVNTGKYIDPALAKLMTTRRAKGMKVIMGDEVGTYYPGPLPMLPLRVAAVSPSERRIKICVVAAGFSLKPGTHVPHEPFELMPVDAALQLSAGSWKVSLYQRANFSCATVKVPMPKW
jgi:hypothetical protein